MIGWNRRKTLSPVFYFLNIKSKQKHAEKILLNCKSGEVYKNRPHILENLENENYSFHGYIIFNFITNFIDIKYIDVKNAKII